MSVLVRGMDLPTSCGTCHLRKSNEDRVWCPILGEYICFETEFLGRKINCPLVEVPTPHGRLIDADALTDKFGISDRDIYCKCVIEEDAPTIIEAEEGEK